MAKACYSGYVVPRQVLAECYKACAYPFDSRSFPAWSADEAVQWSGQLRPRISKASVHRTTPTRGLTFNEKAVRDQMQTGLPLILISP